MEKMVTFYLNGDGMVNVHPKINSFWSETGWDRGEWYFRLTATDFAWYLEHNGLRTLDVGDPDGAFNGFRIELLDAEDGHSYGRARVAE